MARNAWLVGVLLLLPCVAPADEPAPDGAAEDFLATIERSPGLETFLDGRIDALRTGDAALRKQKIRVALIDLPAVDSSRSLKRSFPS